jgi:hypothetical protein
MHWLLLILRDARTRVRSLPNVFGVRAPQDEGEHRVVHSSRFQTAHLVLAARLASEACDFCFAHPNEAGRFTRVHSPSKTGVNALIDALWRNVAGRGCRAAKAARRVRGRREQQSQSSLPGLTRQSILFAKKFLRRRWTRGSSPRVTKELRERDAPLTRLAPSALATLSPLRGARVRSVRVNVRMARRHRG